MMPTQFFHKAINQRWKVNEIVGIQYEIGWVEEVEGVKRIVREHFQSHFKKQDVKRPHWNQTFDCKKLTDAENSMLCEPFTKEEIRKALWNCDSSKGPGPDSFNIKFFKECWSTVKGDIMKFFEEFHSVENL